MLYATHCLYHLTYRLYNQISESESLNQYNINNKPAELIKVIAFCWIKITQCIMYHNVVWFSVDWAYSSWSSSERAHIPKNLARVLLIRFKLNGEHLGNISLTHLSLETQSCPNYSCWLSWPVVMLWLYYWSNNVEYTRGAETKPIFVIN